MGTPPVVSRNDGEWWLRGLPLVSERKQEPPRHRWITRLQSAIAAAVAVMLSGHGVVAAVMGVMIVLSVGTTAESLARTAAMTAGPLLYVIATLAVRADHDLRHTLQIAGLAWFVATWLVILAYDFSRHGERTG